MIFRSITVLMILFILCVAFTAKPAKSVRHYFALEFEAIWNYKEKPVSA